MNEKIYLDILEGLISITGLAITGIAIPYIVGKVGATTLKKYVHWAKIAVEASEQIYASYKGEDKSTLKKEFATTFLRNMFGKKLTDEQISILLESSVYKLGKSIGQAIDSIDEKEILDWKK